MHPLTPHRLNSTPTILYNKSCSIDTLAVTARELLVFLEGNKRFCLWLDAPMGYGKTTITRHLLQALGLENDEVTSPTFTYKQDYYCKDRWYAHFDLYRLQDLPNTDTLEIFDTQGYTGVFVEWPLQSISPQDTLYPTHILKINCQDRSQSTRDILLYKL